MLRSLEKLYGCKILALDSYIGWVNDFLFSDESWTIRYLMVDTRMWISRLKAIPIPFILGETKLQKNSLLVDLTKEQIKKSPDIDLNIPISRQQELEIHRFYGWAPYWISRANHGLNAISQLQTSPEMIRKDANP